MTILDAYAVIAFLRDEPAADAVAPFLRQGNGSLTAAGLAEVTDQLVRVAGVDEDEAALDLAELGLLDAVPVDASIGLAAGRLRAEHHHRRRRDISLADSVAAATARSTGRRLATADPHLLSVCAGEGIGYVALPGTDGSTWTP